ncbi:uncharacterized protein LOC129592316 [Paramacrobiotus metropolitanus]|uniref:uncharacterized protein LOC129592316 n=1 Tax=Paramacrobiotus metropolitanus TaxID=2943436 RepID=UPI0024457912|nr:uncharacterized protein LOC129592316 [Paramacrobiotus metropolitanus]
MEPVQATAGSRSFTAGELVVSCDPLVWVLESNAYKTRCAYCLKENRQLRTCSGCKLHRYCSVSCQTADWKVEHKLECSLLKQSGTGSSMETDRGPSGSSTQYSLDVPRELILKLINKLKLNTMIETSELGPKSAKELWNMLPSNPKLSNINPTEQLCLSVVTDPQLGCSVADMVKYYANIAHNAMPIVDAVIGTAPIGMAVYPLASPRLMTPVCWDMNVVMTFRGRRLFVRAAEDINNYTGLKDLRYNEMQEPFYLSRAGRRAEFEKLHGYPCTCRKCTPQYEAEINPFKCATVGCTNRIPSDVRALQPCTECGAVNKERLKRYHHYMQQHEAIKTRFPNQIHNPLVADLCKELDAADILHPDAHIRYVLGWEVPRKLYDANRFEEGWKMMQELIVCARNIYPKYETFRALVMSIAGASSIDALKKRVVGRVGQLSAAEKKQLQIMSETACPVILDYCRESANIFETLYGENSKEALEGLALVARTTRYVHEIERAFRGRK